MLSFKCQVNSDYVAHMATNGSKSEEKLTYAVAFRVTEEMGQQLLEAVQKTRGRPKNTIARLLFEWALNHYENSGLSLDEFLNIQIPTRSRK